MDSKGDPVLAAGGQRLPEQDGVTANPRLAFISYSSRDAELANSICAALESEGLACWIAPRDVVPGMLYAESIVRAINDTLVFVVVLSRSAMESSHVGKEIERAASKGRPIVTVRTDKSQLTPALEYFLSESHWIETGQVASAQSLELLVRAVRQHSSPQTRAVATTSQTVPVRETGMRHGTMAVVVIVALFMACFVVYTLSGRSRHATTIGRTDRRPTGVGKTSIAVLPFADMSEKHDKEFLADGMSEEILNMLAKVPSLAVIGRTSSFQFKNRNEDLRSIGEKLNATHLLEGSVRSAGDRMRITAELIDARTGSNEWSETYNRSAVDSLELQSLIAASVVRELQLTVNASLDRSSSHVADPEAYDLYLRGLRAMDRLDTASLETAASSFEGALARDPQFAEAAAALAVTIGDQTLLGSYTPSYGFEKGRDMAKRALALDSSVVKARVGLAWIHMIYDWDWVAAEREVGQAARIAPGDLDVLKASAELSADLGKFDDALGKVQELIARDPLSADNLEDLENVQSARGAYREAEDAMRRALVVRPGYAFGHFNIGLALLAQRDYNGALSEMRQETSEGVKLQGLALTLHAVGKKREADNALHDLIQTQADSNALGIAEVYAFRGQPDECFHWLDRATKQKDPSLFRIKGDQFLRGLQKDPRFVAILHAMNLPE